MVKHDWNDTWTFLSSMKRKRRIDYIMCSSDFLVLDAKACNFLDLNSDHRIVCVLLSLSNNQKSQRRNRKDHHNMKGWKPVLDEDGIPTEYDEKLNRYFASYGPENFEDIECAILEVIQDLSHSKPKEYVKP